MRMEYRGIGFFLFLFGVLAAISGVTRSSGEGGGTYMILGLMGALISIVGMMLIIKGGGS